MRRVTHAVPAMVFLLVITAANAWAQFQRMAIPVGKYTIPANGSSHVSAYCLNYERSSPTAKSIFTKVLTRADDTYVTIGQRRMRLQEAMDQGLITVKGRTPTVEALMSALQEKADGMSPSEQARARALLAMWRSLPPEGKLDLEREMRPLLEKNGDHTSLDIVNLTKENVTLDTRRPIPFGSGDDTFEAAETELVRIPSQSIPQHVIQREVWFSAQQRKLQEVGYFDGPIDGRSSVRMSQGAKDFQGSRGLVRDGIVGPKTEAALDRALVSSRRIKRINQDAQGLYRLYVLEQELQGKDPALYILYGDHGRPIYRGNEARELLASLKSSLPEDFEGTLYVEAPQLSEDEVQAFSTTLSLAGTAESETSGIEVRPLSPSGSSDADLRLFFESGARLESAEIAAVEDTDAYAGYYTASFRFHKTARSLTMRAYAKLQRVRDEFVDRVKSAFSGRAADSSVATLVGRIRRDLRRDYHLSSNDLLIELRSQLSRAHIVRIVVRRNTEGA